MIEDTIERWHQHLRGELEGGLDAILAEDCVFYSPIVHTPQVGRELTKLYLNAAAETLPGDTGAASGSTGGATRAFHYVKEVLSGDTAVLEFETTTQGIHVNGVDIIRCDDDGRIVEFRVMIRPLKAINLLHEQMRNTLERMQAG